MVQDVGTANRERGRLRSGHHPGGTHGSAGKRGQANWQGVDDYPHGQGSHCSNLAPNQIVGAPSRLDSGVRADGSQWTRV
jgi:hypothetical protein